MSLEATFVLYFDDDFGCCSHAHQDIFFVEIVNIFYENLVFGDDVD